jgi:hypothetical protein
MRASVARLLTSAAEFFAPTSTTKMRLFVTSTIVTAAATPSPTSKSRGSAVCLDSKKLAAIASAYRYCFEGEKKAGMCELSRGVEEYRFVEFRRKIRAAEVLSAAMQRLISDIQFNGKVSVIIQNGQVLKSGYEEGYFRHHSGT